MSAVSQSSVSCDGFARPRFAARVASAVRRRVRNAVRQLASGRSDRAAELALDWLTVRLAPGASAHVSPEIVCTAGTVLAELGEVELARTCAVRARAAQRADGALPDGTGRVPSLFATSQFVRLSLALEEIEPSCQQSACLACAYNLAHIDRGGRLLCDDESNSLADRWASPLARLSCLAPVATAARRWNEPGWLQLIECAVARARQALDFAPWTTASHVWAETVQALVELGLDDLARASARWLDLAQRDDGALGGHIGSREVSPRATAHAAVMWYSLAERQRADRAIDWLARRQSSDGGFREGHLQNSQAGEIWTAIHFLQAAQAQVRATFAANETELPRTIDAADGRYIAVRRWVEELSGAARVLDAGCGSGRFLTRLAEELPHLRLIGVDASKRALAQIPSAIDRREGDLLRLPLGDGECDAAYVVEALEHALLPRRAIDELCRAVRPGGMVLVIDKCRSRQGLSLHEPWERWFSAEEVQTWLAAHCDDVGVRPIAHEHHRQPTGLFLCWIGRKRAATAIRRSAA